MTLFRYTDPHLRTGLLALNSIKHEEPSDKGGAGATDTPDASELAQFKALGFSPAELDEALNDYATVVKELKSLREKTPSQEKPAGEPEALTEKDIQARNKLLRLFPSLAKLGDLDKIEERTKSIEERTQKLHRADVMDTQSASRREVLRYLIQEHQADTQSAVGQQAYNAVLRIVNAQLASDTDALQRFIDGDRSVIKGILEGLKKDGTFDVLNIPRMKRNGLPYLNGTNGTTTAIKEKAEANREKYAKLSPSQRWAAISRDIYDDVFHQAE